MTRLTLLLHADVLVTMDDARREIADGAVAWRDGAVVAIGTSAELAPLRADADEVIDAAGCVVTPGLVNTHHHLYQSLTRAFPGAVDVPLFAWLKRLYPVWARYRPEDVHAATQLGLAELALGGCSLTSDHLYLYPNGTTLDDSIAAAQEIGLRFNATRGAMSVGESDGGLPPDALVEREPAILADTIRVIDRFHDPREGAMLRIGVAPCSPFSVSEGLMRDAAALARDKGVMLHTHLAEDDADVAYSLDRFGCRPGDYAERLDWVGDDVWHAHCVKLDAREIALFARTGTGVAHCPCSNGRLGSGIAPVVSMRAAGVPIGIGVDGSASNDGANLLLEARQALLMQRAIGGAEALDARTALFLATRGGAQVLGRDDCGSLTMGRRADVAYGTCAAWHPGRLGPRLGTRPQSPARCARAVRGGSRRRARRAPRHRAGDGNTAHRRTIAGMAARGMMALAVRPHFPVAFWRRGMQIMSWVTRGISKLPLAVAASLALAAPGALAGTEPTVPTVPAVRPIPVKVIVIANFEPGADVGDAPGEFQLWAEREKLTEVIPLRGALHPLRRNADGLYGMVWGNPDTMLGGVAEQLMALLLDPRFDFTHTYFLFTGISGVDPAIASVGSAAWSRWVVQGDTLREFDDREAPKGWPYGLFAIGSDAPNKLPEKTEDFAGFTDTGKLAMAAKLNQGLARWAYDMTRNVVIPDSAQLRKDRAAWVGFPNAQKPPFVLMGETLGSVRYWHGPGRTQWARDWVKLWTGGKGAFAMTNMESQSMAGAMAIAAKQGLVDPDRVLVLRTGSNPSMPPPGHSAVDSVANEGAGQLVAFEANYRVGAPVVHELLRNWDKYKDHVPGSDIP